MPSSRALWMTCMTDNQKSGILLDVGKAEYVRYYTGNTVHRPPCAAHLYALLVRAGGVVGHRHTWGHIVKFNSPGAKTIFVSWHESS